MSGTSNTSKVTSWERTTSGEHFRCFLILHTSLGHDGPKMGEDQKNFDAYLAAHPLKQLGLWDPSRTVPYMPNAAAFWKAIIDRPDASSYQGDFRPAAPHIMRSRATEYWFAMKSSMREVRGLILLMRLVHRLTYLSHFFRVEPLG